MSCRKKYLSLVQLYNRSSEWYSCESENGRNESVWLSASVLVSDASKQCDKFLTTCDTDMICLSSEVSNYNCCLFLRRSWTHCNDSILYWKQIQTAKWIISHWDCWAHATSAIRSGQISVFGQVSCTGKHHQSQSQASSCL